MKFLVDAARAQQNPKQTILSTIFSSDDSRIEFFEKMLSISQLNALAKLRGYAIEGTMFPKKINKNTNAIIRPAYQEGTGSYGARKTHPAIELTLVELIIQSVLLQKLKEQSQFCCNALLDKHGASSSGFNAFGIQCSLILVSFCMLYGPLSSLDSQSQEALQSNIEKGLCTPNEGRTMYGERYRRVSPDITCTASVYKTILILVIFLSLSLIYKHYKSQRHAAYLQTLTQEFDSHDYDEMLEALNKNHGISSDLDLDAQVSMGGETNCSIRTLMLTILASFDQDACQALFEKILPKLQQRESYEIELSNNRKMTLSSISPEKILAKGMTQS